MRIHGFISALCAFSLANAAARTVEVSIQPVEVSAKPAPLAAITFDITTQESATVDSYDAPDLPEDTKTVRVGLYDRKAKAWSSSTTVASVENFSKGFSPNIILSTDSQGHVTSVALKGVAIDAGQTRDFGPKAMVLMPSRGTQPQLNKPVTLSAEGKKVPEEQEKTFLQKYVMPVQDKRHARLFSILTFLVRYWWMLIIGAVVLIGSGGDK